MGFKAEVDKVLPGAYKDGLQALGNNSSRVSCKRSRQLSGSVNLDEALKRVEPNASRWDYGLGIERQAGKEEVVWVEVHSASTSNVPEVIDKLTWLKKWLRQKAPALETLTAKKDGYVWIAYGRVAILPGSSEERLLRRNGLKRPRKHLRIE